MRAALSLPLIAGLAAVTFAACQSSTESNQSGADIRIVLNASTKGSAAFSPNPFSVSFAKQATVTWGNADRTSGGYGGSTGTTHHLVSDTGLFDSGSLAPRSTYSFTFAGPGTYTYHCSLHPSMVGTVTITP